MAVKNWEKRAWQPREMQMITEWLAKTQAGKRWMTRVRLGSPRPEVPRPDMSPEELAMIGSWRRWADAIILENTKVTIVEAAIRPEPGDISKLQLYARLFPHTPEFEAWHALPVEMILLYAIEDPTVIFLAREAKIRCIEYKPTWLPSYMQILLPRERRGSQASREIMETKKP